MLDGHDPEATPVDRSRWRQVMANLRQWMAECALPPGARLPSEAELADRFGVHRLTVRQALAELARACVIRTVHGAAPAKEAVGVQYGVSRGVLAEADTVPSTPVPYVNQGRLDAQADHDLRRCRSGGRRRPDCLD